ncbi:toprim domain-containing protein [Glaciihabitans sp. UYNi722]|uniref:toprim domain-containing protein n=1 Tax=Glaciihabitans sp. UYNi722 TaxID=3156344 RepID=UPI003393D3CC
MKRRAPSQIQAILSPFFVGAVSDDGEQRMFCPVCEDPDDSRSPSASVNLGKGEWNCLKGNHGGSVLTLVSSLRGGSAPAASAVPKKTTPKAPIKHKPMENQDRPQQWHDNLMHPGSAERLAYLTDVRGFTIESIKRWLLGWDGQRYTFPVRPSFSPYINTRRYLPGGSPKTLNLPGHGTNILYPLEALRGNTLPVLLVEGEPDVVLANQVLAGEFVALTGTGGAPNPPKDLTPLSGREVFIVYDADDAGRAGAEKILPLLLAVGANARILDIARFEIAE